MTVKTLKILWRKFPVTAKKQAQGKNEKVWELNLWIKSSESGQEDPTATFLYLFLLTSSSLSLSFSLSQSNFPLSQLTVPFQTLSKAATSPWPPCYAHLVLILILIPFIFHSLHCTLCFCPFSFFSFLSLLSHWWSPLANQWSTTIKGAGFRGWDALFRTMTGGREAPTLWWLGYLLSILPLKLTQKSLMLKFGWEPMSLDLLFWFKMGMRIMGFCQLGLRVWVSKIGFWKTQRCLVRRWFKNGALTCLSCLRYYYFSIWKIPFVILILKFFGFSMLGLWTVWSFLFCVFRCFLWQRHCQYRHTQIRNWLRFCISLCQIFTRMPITSLRWPWLLHILRLFVVSSVLR